VTDLIPLGANLPAEGAPRAECILVPFMNGHIPAVLIDDEPWVILKPIVDEMGIGWAPQYTKLCAGQVEGWACVTLAITRLPGDDRARQVVTVSLDTFTTWLAGLQVGRVADSAKRTVADYKREAGRVLRNHFFGKANAFAAEIPKNFADALELAAKQQRAIEAKDAVIAAQHLQIEADKPKVRVFDDWFDPINAVEPTDFAKRIGLRSAQQLNGHLRDLGIMRRDKHPRTGKVRNLPTADWGHCFRVKPERIPTGGFVDVAWILPEGQLEIVEELRNHGLIDF
jgi:phage antirepressor YoqD-like protein